LVEAAVVAELTTVEAAEEEGVELITEAVVVPEVAVPAVRTPATTVATELSLLAQEAVVVSVDCVPPAVSEVDESEV